LSILTLNVFNVVAGVVTIASAGFSLVVYLRESKRVSVEREKLNTYRHELRSMLTLAETALKQATLTATVADREEVSKKELKHLSLALMATLEGLVETSTRALRISQNWQFGIPSKYYELESTSDSGAPVPDVDVDESL
jgi:hypothetical protein